MEAAKAQNWVVEPEEKKSLILSSHLRICLPRRLIPFGFPIKIPYTFVVALTRATFPAHLVFLLILTSS
jgi:hypothetical protein